MMGNKKGQEITFEGIHFFRGDALSSEYIISYILMGFLMGCHFPLGFNCQEQEERAGLYITCNNIHKDNNLW